MYALIIKRILDVVLATVSLVFLSPIFAFIAVAIRIEDGSPVFFIQERIGRGGKRFRLIKFRSMPTNSQDIPSAEATTLQVTRVGSLIRRSNIDELPQLVNILLGEMSLIGPRPALPSQRKLLALRLENGAMECKPGLTGVAQVKSYDSMPEEEKARYDGEYACCISFMKDTQIFFRTFQYLLRRPPVY